MHSTRSRRTGLGIPPSVPFMQAMRLFNLLASSARSRPKDKDFFVKKPAEYSAGFLLTSQGESGFCVGFLLGRCLGLRHFFLELEADLAVLGHQIG